MDLSQDIVYQVLFQEEKNCPENIFRQKILMIFSSMISRTY